MGTFCVLGGSCNFNSRLCNLVPRALSNVNTKRNAWKILLCVVMSGRLQENYNLVCPKTGGRSICNLQGFIQREPEVGTGINSQPETENYNVIIASTATIAESDVSCP